MPSPRSRQAIACSMLSTYRACCSMYCFKASSMTQFRNRSMDFASAESFRTTSGSVRMVMDLAAKDCTRNDIKCTHSIQTARAFGESLYRKALRKARCVSCVSEPLAQWVRDLKGDASAVLALPSTVDRDLFRPRDRLACRRSLGLPVHAQLVGSAGGLSRSKGIATLYQAFDRLADRMPNLHLVLAGAVEPSCPPPDHPRVHLLGSLSHSRIAELFSALDVGVVYLRDTAYGRFSFPQKAYEMAACGLPLVIARVGAMGDTFAGSGAEFYAADDALALACGLDRQLASPQKPDVVLTDWAQQAEILEGAYRTILSRDSF
jgi:teichuronic acid biosynthesis glycosyltransferase TuaC